MDAIVIMERLFILSMLNLLIDQACGQVSEIVVEKLCVKLKRDYDFGTINFQEKKLYITKFPHGVFLVTTQPQKNRVASTSSDYSWGPPLWKDAHEKAGLIKTKEEQEAYLVWFAEQIPCGPCGTHWKKLVAENPLTDDFVTWFFDRHNDINLYLNKPKFLQQPT